MSDNFGGGFGDDDAAAGVAFGAVSDAVAANPGIWKSDDEKKAFMVVVQSAVDSTADVGTKGKIVSAAIAAVEGGLAGGLPGALAAVLAKIF